MHGEEISNGHEDNSVLVVNDEPDQLKLMTSLLNKAGYSVLAAADPERALDPPPGVDLRGLDERAPRQSARI